MKVTDLRIGNCVHDIRDMYTKTQNRVHKRINMYIKIQIETIYMAERKTEAHPIALAWVGSSQK